MKPVCLTNTLINKIKQMHRRVSKRSTFHTDLLQPSNDDSRDQDGDQKNNIKNTEIEPIAAAKDLSALDANLEQVQQEPPKYILKAQISNKMVDIGNLNLTELIWSKIMDKVKGNGIIDDSEPISAKTGTECLPDGRDNTKVEYIVKGTWGSIRDFTSIQVGQELIKSAFILASTLAKEHTYSITYGCKVVGSCASEPYVHGPKTIHGTQMPSLLKINAFELNNDNQNRPDMDILLIENLELDFKAFPIVREKSACNHGFVEDLAVNGLALAASSVPYAGSLLELFGPLLQVSCQ